MSDNSAGRRHQTLNELKVALKSATDVYVRVDILAGHYVRVVPADFREAIRDMQAARATHPHPTRFKFTVEGGIVWVHSCLAPRAPKPATTQPGP